MGISLCDPLKVQQRPVNILQVVRAVTKHPRCHQSLVPGTQAPRRTQQNPCFPHTQGLCSGETLQQGALDSRPWALNVSGP